MCTVISNDGAATDNDGTLCCKYCKYVAVLMVDPPAMIVIGSVKAVSVPSNFNSDVDVVE